MEPKVYRCKFVEDNGGEYVPDTSDKLPAEYDLGTDTYMVTTHDRGNGGKGFYNVVIENKDDDDEGWTLEAAEDSKLTLIYNEGLWYPEVKREGGVLTCALENVTTSGVCTITAKKENANPINIYIEVHPSLFEVSQYEYMIARIAETHDRLLFNKDSHVGVGSAESINLSLWDELKPAVRKVMDSPATLLKQERQTLPKHKIRQYNNHIMREMLTHSGKNKLTGTVYTEEFDTQENQTIKAVLRQCLRRFDCQIAELTKAEFNRQINDELSELGKSTLDEKDGFKKRRLTSYDKRFKHSEQFKNAKKEIEETLETNWFKAITDTGTATITSTPRFIHDPAYRTIYSILKAHPSYLLSGMFDKGIHAMHRIYEYWVFHELLDRLLNLGFSLRDGDDGQERCNDIIRSFISGNDSEPEGIVIPLEREVELRNMGGKKLDRTATIKVDLGFNVLFGESKRGKCLRPDYYLRVRQSSGKANNKWYKKDHWYFLDAKCYSYKDFEMLKGKKNNKIKGKTIKEVCLDKYINKMKMLKKDGLLEDQIDKSAEICGAYLLIAEIKDHSSKDDMFFGNSAIEEAEEETHRYGAAVVHPSQYYESNSIGGDDLTALLRLIFEYREGAEFINREYMQGWENERPPTLCACWNSAINHAERNSAINHAERNSAINHAEIEIKSIEDKQTAGKKKKYWFECECGDLRVENFCPVPGCGRPIIKHDVGNFHYPDPKRNDKWYFECPNRSCSSHNGNIQSSPNRKCRPHDQETQLFNNPEVHNAQLKTVLLKSEVAQHPTNPDQFLVIPIPNEYKGKRQPVKTAIALDKARFTESYEVMDENGKPNYIVDLRMAGTNKDGLYLPNVVDVLDDKGEPTGEKRPYNDLTIKPNSHGDETAYMQIYDIPKSADGKQPAERLDALVKAIDSGQVRAKKRCDNNVEKQLLHGSDTVVRRYDRQLAASGRIKVAGPEWLNETSPSGCSIADTTILVHADDMRVLYVEGVDDLEDGYHCFVRINDDLCVEFDPNNKATHATADPGRGADLALAKGIESISYTVSEPDDKGKMVNVQRMQKGPFRLLGLPKGDEPSLKSYHTTIRNGKFMPRLDSPNEPISASNIDNQLNRGNAASNPFKASDAYAKAGRASVKHEPGMIQGIEEVEEAIFRDKFVQTFLKPDKEHPGNYVARNQKIKDAHGEAWAAAKGKVDDMVKDLSKEERADLDAQVEEQIKKYIEDAKAQPEFADKTPKTPEPKTTAKAPEAETEAEPEFLESWDRLT